MKFSDKYISELQNKLSQPFLKQLISQADVRRILQEMKENPENYPSFDALLTEKSTYVAYVFITYGCSLLEDLISNCIPMVSLEMLEHGGNLLANVYKYNNNESDSKDFNLLIAGMALYAAKQFSRAFIVLNDVNLDFLVGQIVIQFIKKDFDSVLQNVSQVFIEIPPDVSDMKALDEWVISHEIARVFLMIIDFTQTGEDKYFNIINDILNKLLLIATESNLISYWLIVRLVRIIFSTLRESSLWNVLRPYLPDLSVSKAYIRLLSEFKPPIIELWPSQIAAIPLAVGDNRGCVISLRTSGGKTRIAEIAILFTLTKNINSKVLYLAHFGH